MSKHIASIPLADIERIAIVTGNGRSMAQVKGDADYICNAGFYDMTTGRPVGHLKADGAVLAKEVWGCWGFAWDRADIKMSALPDAKRTNYISGVEMLSPMIGIHDAMHYRPEVGGSRPRTAMALTGDKLLLYCADSPSTPEALRDTLYKLGPRLLSCWTVAGRLSAISPVKKSAAAAGCTTIWRCGCGKRRTSLWTALPKRS